jgi:hypothetical protein
MEFPKIVLMVFGIVLPYYVTCIQQEGEKTNSMKNFVFDLPDLVVSHHILGKEVQLEAFPSKAVT